MFKWQHETCKCGDMHVIKDCLRCLLKLLYLSASGDPPSSLQPLRALIMLANAGQCYGVVLPSLPGSPKFKIQMQLPANSHE